MASLCIGAVANLVQMKIENNEMHIIQVVVDDDYGIS